MNTHVPVRLPVCHMHANVYLETRIHIYKRTYVLHSYRQTYIRKRMHTYVRTDVRTDGQTDRCTGASMSNDQLLCELKKI